MWRLTPFFSRDDGDGPVTAWKENTHANKADGRLTVDRHWQSGNRRIMKYMAEWCNSSITAFEAGGEGAEPSLAAI